MAGWGIGLGGFATGLDSGIKGGVSLANAFSEKKARESRERYQAAEIDLRKKADARAQQQFDEQEHDRQRNQQDEDARRDTFTQGNDAYNAAVKAGTAKPNDAYDWFAHSYAPNIEQFYLAKGDVQNAATFHKWSKDADTQQQIRDMGSLVGRYHDAVQTGDFDPLKGGLTKFYNDLPSDVTGGKKFTDLNVARDANNNVTAVTAAFQTPDGKTVTQNLGDMGQFQQYLQGVLNPAALYEHTMASETQAQKFKADIGEYAAKKNIDLKEDAVKRTIGLTGKMPQERYADAQAALLKNSTNGKPPTDAQVRAYLAQQDAYAASNAPGLGGAVRPPAPSPMIVDTKTNQVVGPNGQSAGAPAPQAPASPSAITSPPPGTPPPDQASSPGAPAPNPQAIDLAVAPPAQQATQPSPTGLTGAPAPSGAVMPQAGPNAAPQYPTTSNIDAGAAVGRGIQAIGRALKGGPPAPLNIDQINAARRATGQPPLTADQAAQLLNTAGAQPPLPPQQAAQPQQAQQQPAATPTTAPEGTYGLPM